MIINHKKAPLETTFLQQHEPSTITEEEQIFHAFSNTPKTMKMVEIEYGIDRANQCRYIAKLRKNDMVAVVRRGICPITKHRAGFLTTNPTLFPKETVQLSLFNEKGGVR